MGDFDDLDTYNGDTEHDMWVDTTFHENTGELINFFIEKEDVDFIINFD